MKKTMTFAMILLSLLFLYNCAPKTAKEMGPSTNKSGSGKSSGSESGTTGNSNVVKEAQAERSNIEQVNLLSQSSDQRVQMGKGLYESSCNKCHNLHAPGSRSAVSWVEIMKTMGPKAKLETANYLMISAYLVKNAK